MSCGADPFTSAHLQHYSRLKRHRSAMGGTVAMRVKGLLAFVCAVALMAGCNKSSRTSSTIENREAGSTGTAGSDVSGGDRNFVNDQLSGGMAEVDLAKIAKDRAANADVKQYAQMMIDDHTKAADQLKRIAATYSIPVDAKIDDKETTLMDKLSKLKGSDFDKEYMSVMVADHESVVRDLRSRVNEDRTVSERLSGKNPENPAAVSPERSANKVTM